LAKPIDNLVARLIQDSHDTALIWQVGILLVCAALAWLVMRLIQPYLVHGGNRWAAGRGGVRRVGFPLAMWLALLLCREVIERWIGETFLLDVAVPLLLALMGVRLLAYGLRYVFKPSEKLKVWERTLSWLVWGVFAAHITGLAPRIHAAMEAVSFESGSHRFSLLLLVQAALVILVALIVSLGIAQFIENRLMGFSQMNLSLRMALVKTIRTLLIILAVLVALPAVGIDLTVLSVFGGALGVGIGFGLQKIASNYISGFIILLDRSVRIGDMITLNDQYGRVSQINTRYTLLKALNGTESIIPNEMLISQIVVNHSLTQPDVCINLPIQVAYGTDLERARDILLETASVHPRVIQGIPGEAPKVSLKEFADNGIVLELGVWIRDPSEGQQNLRSDINWELWRRFREAGIEIPFPQRVVRVVSTDESAEKLGACRT
jgi:small-conductance mechanosensitive channel